MAIPKPPKERTPLHSPSQTRRRPASLRFGSRSGKNLRPVSRHRKGDGRLLNRNNRSRSRADSREDGGDGSGSGSGRRRRRRRSEVGLLSNRRESLLSRRGLPQPLSDLAARLTLVRAVGDEMLR